MDQKRREPTPEEAARQARFDAFIERLQRDPFEVIDESDEGFVNRRRAERAAQGDSSSTADRRGRARDRGVRAGDGHGASPKGQRP